MSMLCQPNQEPDHVAAAVLALIRKRLGSGLDDSWSTLDKRYEAEPRVAEWYNGREAGYVIYMRSRHHNRQINIAFFEHRNSDDLCAVDWEGTTLNPPTISEIPESCPYYHSKYKYSFGVPYNRPFELAEWIVERLQAFWLETSAK